MLMGNREAILHESVAQFRTKEQLLNVMRLINEVDHFDFFLPGHCVARTQTALASAIIDVIENDAAAATAAPSRPSAKL